MPNMEPDAALSDMRMRIVRIQNELLDAEGQWQVHDLERRKELVDERGRLTQAIRKAQREGGQ